ncbi:MAG: helix-turn-helix domain-containing protein [Sciscionella sp.]
MSLDKDQLAFGERLRGLRARAGFATGKEFAGHLGWVAPKVSRIENGNQLPSDADVVTWLDAATAPTDLAVEIRDQLRELRLARASWKRRLRTGHAPVQRDIGAAERDAKRIRAVEYFLVPGLVQTAEYARAVFGKLAGIHESPPDSEAAVRQRMKRQEVLYEPDKRIELLVAENALRYPICPAEALRRQIDRLVSVAGMDHVRLGVIPQGIELPVAAMHGFWILDDIVLIEIHHTEVTATEPEDIALYNRIADTLWSVALEGDEARHLLLQVAEQYTDASTR